MQGTILKRILVGLGVVLLSMILILALVNYQLTKNQLLESAKTKLIGDLELGYRYLDTRFPGEWEVRDGVLYKGGVRMNENYEIVDEIGQATGGNTVTLFLYDTRITTNVLTENGERAIGTAVSDEVKEVVLNQQQRYIGRANVVGYWNQTAYDPIFDKDHNVIGIWYTGVPEQPYLDEAKRAAWINILISAAVMLFLFAVASVFVSRNLSKPIKLAVGWGQEMAKGNFCVQIPEAYLRRTDEVGQLARVFAQMTDNLTSIIRQAQDSAAHVSAASTEFSKGAEQIRIASHQVAEAVQEIAAGVAEQSDHANEILHMMERSGELSEQGLHQADETLTKSRQSTQTAHAGEQAIQSAMNHLKEITQQVEQAVESVANLGRRSDEIGEIITTISAISAETHMLALNAAIEAARANEHGRGFAVVAEEVRKLAEGSSKSARQITELIHRIQGETKATIDAMQQVAASVHQQVELIEKGREALREMVRQTEDTERAAHRMNEIFRGLNEYSANVLQAVRNISHIIEHNSSSAEEVSSLAEEQAATVEEISSSSAQLKRMAEELQHQVEQFQIDPGFQAGAGVNQLPVERLAHA